MKQLNKLQKYYKLCIWSVSKLHDWNSNTLCYSRIDAMWWKGQCAQRDGVGSRIFLTVEPRINCDNTVHPSVSCPGTTVQLLFLLLIWSRNKRSKYLNLWEFLFAKCLPCVFSQRGQAFPRVVNATSLKESNSSLRLLVSSCFSFSSLSISFKIKYYIKYDVS